MTAAPIRVGFLGLSATGGWAATALAPPLFDEPLASAYKLVAVSTSNTKSAAASAKAYGEKAGHVVKGYHDAADLANDPEVDLVAVCVKVHEHRAALLPALAKGKAVFSEWPLAKSLDEAKELTHLANEAGVRTMIGLQGWNSPVVQKVRGWIADGKIGRVLGVTWLGQKASRRLNLWGPTTSERAKYTLDPENGVTLVSIPVSHDLTAITRMLGPFNTVAAIVGKTWPTTQVLNAERKPTGESLAHVYPDHIGLTATFKHHPGAILSARWRSAPATGEKNKHRPALVAIIDGEEGVIRFELPANPYNVLQIVTPAKVYLNDEEVEFEPTTPSTNTATSWKSFAKGTDGDYPTWADAVILHEQVVAIEKSFNEGVRVSI
ncbi:NAD-binding Rossmann fold oxidoreductase [Auriculariales sp. MPI-PUGE-AT-0066]|nr:NAD-binding Rossmann fold oxidoreductase [Auriculariales sp. MPI-PUGE-AT-0066]